jgi:uncharacterized repeat protein (TIGR01451 family)
MSRIAPRLFVAAIAVAALFLAATVSSAAPTVISSGNISTPIPDKPSTTPPITLSLPTSPVPAGTIQDVNVYVRADHTAVGDLTMKLKGPDGHAVTLIDRRGGAGDNLGEGATDCTGTLTGFDDQAATQVTAASAPFDADPAYKPEGTLSDFNTTDAAGTWALEITDNTSGETGTVYCWKLEITYAQADVKVTLADSQDPAVVDTDLTYTATVKNNGPDASAPQTVTYTLPAGVTLKQLTTTATGGTCNAIDTPPAKCNIGSLAANAEVTVTAVVTPTEVGTIQVSAAATPTDSVPANNTATESTVVGDGGNGTELIKVTTDGGGRGVVKSDPAGIDCGYTCEAGFVKGTQVKLSVTPATGSVFAGWGGVCEGTPVDSDCVVNAEGTKNVTATFKPDKGSGGSGSGGGGSGGSGSAGGGSGGGTFDVCTITGTNKNDTLRGTPKADVICGLGGSDRIYGFGGNDRIYGGNGNDKLFGGSGNDKIWGGNGTDTIDGGPGKDKSYPSVSDKLKNIEGSL